MRNARLHVAKIVFTTAMVALICGAARAQSESNPVWPTRQWQASTPEEQGMDSAALAELIEFGQTRNLAIRCC